MRIVAAVVAGAVLLASGSAANAAEAQRQRSEKCLEICNFTFEQCRKDTGPKASGRCDIDIVRCKNACPFVTIEEPAVPTAMSHQRCIDRCQETYQKCLRRPENKRGGNCAADDVRCEQACPKPPEPAVAAGAPAAEGGGSGAAPAAATPPKKVKRGLRIEGAAAPAPISPPPVVAPAERPVPAAEYPAGSVPARGEAVPPAAIAPASAAPAAAAPAAAAAAPAAAAHPQPAERGFWATLGCFFVQCEQPGMTPCLKQCGDAYDQCRVRESKRGGECNTRLMNCRKDCSAASAGR
ncbi:MAG: hypothetical protein IT294_02910 [Deltaproteobacteria bacterium]|nr:hypothetical protein [Deltaproteobacteria bacterium]